MRQLRGIEHSRLTALKSAPHVTCPRKLTSAATLQAVGQRFQHLTPQDPPVEVDHAQISLKVLGGGGERKLADSLHPVVQRFDAAG